jgi:hypothetical protein
MRRTTDELDSFMGNSAIRKMRENEVGTWTTEHLFGDFVLGVLVMVPRILLSRNKKMLSYYLTLQDV